MKSLSQVSKNTLNTLQEKKNNTSVTPQPTSIKDGGTTNIMKRDKPLMESELTLIASRMLLKPLSIVIVRNPIQSSKPRFDDELTQAIAGYEDDVEVEIYFRDSLGVQMFEAALRHSPPTAITKHLTHLCLHKRLGTDDKDRAVLLKDYTESLRAYSDFTVYVVCKYFWEQDHGGFFPKIAIIRAACEAVHKELVTRHGNLIGLGRKSPQEAFAEKYYTDDRQHPMRRVWCDYLISKGKEDYFDQVRSQSNYALEMLAKTFGWRKPEKQMPSETPIPAPEAPKSSDA